MLKQKTGGCVGYLAAGIVGAVVLFAIVLSMDTGTSTGSRSSTKRPAPPDTSALQPPPALDSAEPTPAKPTAAAPAHEVVKRDTSDTPIKTQTELHAVVSGSFSEAGLKQLLQSLYDEARSGRGFKYQGGKPTHVFLYLYSSREHFESGMGQWIAMLSKVGEDSPIDVQVKTELISGLDAKPKAKYGLSEQQRRDAFKALVMAEDRANNEAERLYPLPDPLKPGYSQARVKAQLDKQLEAADSLKKRYKEEVASTYSVTEEQLDEISIEGLTKNWPMP